MLADSASGKGLQASWFAGGLLLSLHKAMAVRGGSGEEGRKRRRKWGEYSVSFFLIKICILSLGLHSQDLI